MKIEIMYQNGIIQIKELVKCRTKQGEITFNSAFYEAIENGSLCFNLGYGQVNFTVSGNETHVSMQDKMFHEWRKYWIYKDGKYYRKHGTSNRTDSQRENENVHEAEQKETR